MQFFTRNWVYTPNFGLKIRIFLRFTPHFEKKNLKFASPFQKSAYGPAKTLVNLNEMYAEMSTPKMSIPEMS